MNTPHAGAAHFVATSIEKRCGVPIWSAPALLFGGEVSNSAIARFPSVGVSEAEVLVVGSNLRSFSEPIERSGLLSTLLFGGNQIGSPAGNWFFMYPRALPNDDGSFTLVWAEPSSKIERIGAYEWGQLTPQSLWVADYTVPSGWTLPQRIYDGPVLWTDRPGEKIVRTRDGVAHLIFAVLEVQSSLKHASRRNGMWSVASIPETPRAVYASSVAYGDTLIVGYIGAVGGGSGQDRNSVFVLRSTDRGETWKHPELIRRSRALGAFDLAMAGDQLGKVHLLWSQETAGGNRSIVHVVSRNSGNDWEQPKHVTNEVSFNIAPAAAVDRCGRLHVVYREIQDAGKTGRIVHALWDEEWSSPTMLFADLLTSGPLITALADGRLLILFLGRPNDSLSSTHFSSLFSISIP